MPTDRILAIVDRQTPKLRRILLDALTAARPDQLEQLTLLLEAGRIVDAVNLAVDIPALQAGLAEAAGVLRGAVGTAASITEAGFGLSFTLDDPLAVRVAESLAANMVTNVTAETKQAIRDIVVRGFREGIAPRVQAREIMGLVGLTRRDAGAADRYLAGLLADGMDPTRAESLFDRYTRRLLRRRAENIARTEMRNAATQGRRLGWQQAADAGYLDPASTRIIWMVTPDDRLCARCAPMAGQTVGFYDAFTSRVEATGDLSGNPGGITPFGGSTRALAEHVTVNGPPLHPSCRCDIALAV